jgi:16S rRNA (cytosine1402-N4)-methyltransferase
MDTPPSPHRPIMVAEVLRYLRPAAGEVAVDCTLGGGGHAHAILERLSPGGRLIALDVDPIELPRTERRLREAGFCRETFVAHHANFTTLAEVLAAEGVPAANVILADLGVSSMQHDRPERGFSFRGVGPLDMRMDPSRGETAAQLLARLDSAALAALLTTNADEPHAELIAGILTRERPDTTHALTRLVRIGLNAARPDLPKAAVKMSVRRTLQALRIAVNDEFAALEGLLMALPQCLAPGGRVVIMTFHSGEDRRVKKSFQAGLRAGVYSAVADQVVRSTKEETFANRRASSAKLRWAVRAAC